MATSVQMSCDERPQRNCVSDRMGILRKKEAKEKEKEIKGILCKPAKLRSKDEKKMLRECKDVAKEIERRARLQKMVKMKTQEIEDSSDVLDAKIDELVSAIKQAKHMVVYTGAGISTAASIPDYRGPNGVWTLLQKGQNVRTKSLVDADPTLTHMAITKLHQEGLIQHIVSQNCDGLHLRSGLPQRALSEIHGNMFIEVCTGCDPEVQFIRPFDVTERTACRRHWTGRSCPTCDGPLRDSIVHFGEKGSVEQPLNWPGAVAMAMETDMILCIGSTLKVLKRYTCLWGTGRPKAKQPKLFIINLQWTPKDKMAVLKIHGRCDDVMQQVMSRLELKIPEYDRSQDPIISMAMPLRKQELDSFNTKLLQAQPTARSVQNEPVPTGSDQNVKADTNDSLVTLEQAGTPTVKTELSSRTEGNIEVKTETDFSAQSRDSNENAVLTKPGWFGKGYHKKVTRGRKRRKLSQDSV